MDRGVLEQELAAWKYTAEVYEKRNKALMRCQIFMVSVSIVSSVVALLTLMTILMKTVI